MSTELAHQILTAQKPAGFPVRLVAIDGHGGAGKTTLARKLAHELGAETLHTDDFASYDNPMEWWPRFMDEAIGPIANGATTLSYERGSWYKTHQPEPVVDQVVTPIMILEGVGSSRSHFRPYLSYTIWVDTPADECMRRGIERDLAQNMAQKSPAEIEDDWRKWHQYELEYVASEHPQDHADMIVDGGMQKTTTMI